MKAFPVALTAGLMALGGCASYPRPFETEPARPALRTAATSELEALPPPAEKVVVAVYRFRDQTGQYRALENASTFSTAVTQGATSILIQALEASGWFVPIEREGLSNLLNERQIVSSIRAQHTGPEGERLGPLPPLLYAGVLLEGGIVGYDTNVTTGGIGARYFGAGGSGQVRQDQVTVYLRAVSTQTGRVLKTVQTTKTVLSQRLEAGVFRFVALRRLLEAEAGFSYNEPTVIAVTEAIEEAVRALVIEGVREELWALARVADVASPAFLAYDADVAEAERADAFGFRRRPNRPGLGVGVLGGATRYEGDYADPLARPVGEFVLRRQVAPRLGLGLSASVADLAAEDAFSQRHVAGDVHAVYYALPHYRLTPYLTLGAGALYQSDIATDEAGEDDGLFPYLTAGGGFEWMAAPRLGFHLALVHVYPLEEGLDGVRLGRVHDNFYALKTGFVFYAR